MTVLEKCTIIEVAILERCLYWKGVHIREMSELARYGSVHIREVPVLEKCPY